MSIDPLISTFPAPLARLILCGGGGLPPAFGPLTFVDPHYLDRTSQPATWSGQARLAYASDDYDCDAWGMDAFESGKMEWRLSLPHWRDRLALVAAWMLGWNDVRAAHVQHHNQSILLTFWTASADLVRGRAWGASSGVSSTSANPDLLTLSAHLRTHDPAVALILALYDVPEIRARVEAP